MDHHSYKLGSIDSTNDLPGDSCPRKKEKKDEKKGNCDQKVQKQRPSKTGSTELLIHSQWSISIQDNIC